jgi:hypothetical protein
MRSREIVAVLVAGALAGVACPQAGAAEHLIRVPLRTSGSIKVVWHGDRARGCAAAGLCAYSGSIRFPGHGRGFLEREQGPRSFLGFFGILDNPGTTVVRTERAVPGGEPAVCSQRSRFQVWTLDDRHAWGDRRWLGLGTDVSPAPAGSAQCAGPRIEDFAPSLPTAVIRRNSLDRRGARVSLAGRFPFKSGPLSGHVISTLSLRSRGARRVRVGGGRALDEGGKHELYVELRYRATRLEGEVRSDFRAIDAPICKVRDACGTHGSEVYSLDAAGETVDVTGFATTSSRRRPSLRSALRKVIRHGFLDAFVQLDRKPGLSAQAFVRPDGATCTDHFQPRQPPGLALFGEEGRLALTMFSGGASILQGRCPGPEDPQPHGDEIARTRVPPGRLAKRVLALRLRKRHGFRSGAYSGTFTARMNLRLRRTRVRVMIDPKFGREGSLREHLFITGVRQRP